MNRFQQWLKLAIVGYAGVIMADEPVQWRTIEFTQQSLRMEVEVVSNYLQRQQGLMGRSRLEPNKGMLFIYEREDELGVWMKNTLLPLDVLFLNSEGRIVSVLQNLQPCRISRCPVYSSQGMAQYMLEFNAGFAAQHRIAAGQQVKLGR